MPPEVAVFRWEKTQQKNDNGIHHKTFKKITKVGSTRVPTMQSKFVKFLLLLPDFKTSMKFSERFKSFLSSFDLFLAFSPAISISVHHMISFHCPDSLQYLSNCLGFAERSSSLFDSTQLYIDLFL